VTSAKLLSATAAFILLAGPALAASPRGTWRVEDGSGTVRIATCGRQNLCGYTPEGKVVLKNMSPNGANKWAGTMIDLRNGGTVYTGSMALTGENSLQVQGCVPGGGLCGSETWGRVR
jgi:uncharacterized protein (DUF2147 family)